MATKEKGRRPMANQHRVNVNFSDSAYKALEELARSQEKTMAEVLRDAIALEKWFQDTHEGGGRVIVEENGRSREIIPR
jgi:hypothetical protein